MCQYMFFCFLLLYVENILYKIESLGLFFRTFRSVLDLTYGGWYDTEYSFLFKSKEILFIFYEKKRDVKNRS